MSDTWDKIKQWGLVIPPSRPSPFQLHHIRIQIGHLDRNADVAVLGSTPEFRDLLFQLGFKNISVLDKNASFYNQMTAARIFKSAETFVEGDWLDSLESCKNRFAIILSDLTSGNIDYTKRDHFYAAIGNALLPEGGMFFDKVLTNELPRLTLSQIATRYSWMPVNLQTVNYFSCESLFCSEFIDRLGIVDTTRFYDWLLAEFHSERLQKLTELAQLVTPRGCIWYYGKPWDLLSKSYCPHLRTVETISMPDDGPYLGRVKHTVMVRP